MQQVNKPKKPMMFYYMVVLVILFLLNFLLFPQLLKPDVKEVDYGTFLSMVDKKEVSKVQIEDDMIYFQDKEETPNYYETAAFEDPDLVERLYDAGCSFDRVVQKEMSPLLSFLLTWILPILIFAGLGELLGRSMMKRMGGGSGAMQFGKSNAKIYVQSETGIKFGDVAGEDEAKEILQEIVDSCTTRRNTVPSGRPCQRERFLWDLRVPEKRCLQRRLPEKPMCRFSPFPVRNS